MIPASVPKNFWSRALAPLSSERRGKDLQCVCASRGSGQRGGRSQGGGAPGNGSSSARDKASGGQGRGRKAGRPSSNAGRGSGPGNKGAQRGGNARGSSTGTTKNGGAAEQEPKRKASPWVTAPCGVQRVEVLAESAAAPQPVWASFVGHCEGVWCGTYSAFDIDTCKAQPVALDDNKRKVTDMFTQVHEKGGEAAQGRVALLRRTARGITRQACFDSLANDEDAEKSCLLSDDGGFLYFDGGSYSCSPTSIGTNAFSKEPITSMDDDALFGVQQDLSQEDIKALFREVKDSNVAPHEDEDDDDAALRGRAESDDEVSSSGGARQALEDARLRQAGVSDWAERGEELRVDGEEGVEGELEDDDDAWKDVARAEMAMAQETGVHRVSTLEHCLVVNGSERVRTQILLETAGGLDSELDVCVLRLVLWKEAWQGSLEMKGRVCGEPAGMSSVPRASMADSVGDWHALQLSAVLLHPEPGSCDMDRSDFVKLYFSQEVAQQWTGGAPSPTEDGFSWWLPYGVSVTLTMLPSSLKSCGNGDDDGAGFNLLMRTAWAHSPRFQAVMETEYNPQGLLLESRSCTLVPAVNDIPDMAQPASSSP